MFETLKNRLSRSGRTADWVSEIRTADEWAAMSARFGYSTVARTEGVRFVIDLDDSGRTYFLNTHKGLTHYDFVVRFLNPHDRYDRFLVAQYKRGDRRFILGTIVYYLDGDHWTIELDRTDTMSANMIGWMFSHVVPKVTVTKDLRFRPASMLQASNAEALSDRIAVLSMDAINASVTYQPVVLGVAFGYLRLVRGDLDIASLRPYDIVVTDHVPIEIPPVAALVTSELQAPLAHVAVLSRNRNTPDMAARGAVDLDPFRALEGELVKLTVGGQDYRLERANRAEAETAWKAARPRQAIVPQRDLSVDGFVDVDALPTNAARIAGAKAAQVAELGRIDGIATPGGFVLPFSAYSSHLESTGVAGGIHDMLRDPQFQSDAKMRACKLQHVREAIMSHPVAADLVTGIRRKLLDMAADGPYIFRSSSNAEDLPGFNGAGLYDSLSVAANPSDAQIADALRGVWASVWMQRAFEDREWYRIDHESVAMAVLFQPLVHDAVATGVAITENPFKPGNPAVFINSQTVGTTVTGAVANELPEQFLVSTAHGDFAPELLSRSSVTGGAPVLSTDEVLTLTQQLLRIQNAMLPRYGADANAMDVEFALTARRRFVILQARPHSIVYDIDRVPPKNPGLTPAERILWRWRRLARRFNFRSPRRIYVT